MKLKIQDFYSHPYVSHIEWENLVLFSYTRECQYERKWDEITLSARGLIFDKNTGEVVSRVFRKFFNLGEIDQTFISNLPSCPFTITNKLDGSLGISFPYKNEYRVATRGSFQSDQAKCWMQEHIYTGDFKRDYTYLFEIIYKENKIVISYGDFEGLVLIGCSNKETGEELSYELLKKEANRIHAPVVEQITGFKDIEELYQWCKALPATKEGVVITFENGLKVKIKADEYVKIHKMISRMTPISFWEAWDLETRQIPISFLSQVPEEFRETTDALQHQVESMHTVIYKKVEQALQSLVERLGASCTAKDVALAAKSSYPDLFGYIMHLFNKKHQKLWSSIHASVRPTGNVLPSEDMPGMARIKRILQNN